MQSLSGDYEVALSRIALYLGQNGKKPTLPHQTIRSPFGKNSVKMHALSLVRITIKVHEFVLVRVAISKHSLHTVPNDVPGMYMFSSCVVQVIRQLRDNQIAQDCAWNILRAK